jgi:hypothetical protein
MTMRKGLRLVNALITLMLSFPIWFFLWYSLMKATNQDRLVWFLFWCYVPLNFFLGLLSVIVDKAFDE